MEIIIACEMFIIMELCEGFSGWDAVLVETGSGMVHRRFLRRNMEFVEAIQFSGKLGSRNIFVWFGNVLKGNTMFEKKRKKH